MVPGLVVGHQLACVYIRQSVIAVEAETLINTASQVVRRENKAKTKIASSGPPKAAVSFFPMSNTLPKGPTKQASEIAMAPMITTRIRIHRTSLRSSLGRS